MEILAARVLLHPRDLTRSTAFYRDTLGLAVFREFETPGGTGTVFFTGGGYLEVSGERPAERFSDEDLTAGSGLQLWFQVRDVHATYRELRGRGVTIVEEPQRRPWGLIEMWVHDPDWVEICVVEVPKGHPLRWRSLGP